MKMIKTIILALFLTNVAKSAPFSERLEAEIEVPPMNVKDILDSNRNEEDLTCNQIEVLSSLATEAFFEYTNDVNADANYGFSSAEEADRYRAALVDLLFEKDCNEKMDRSQECDDNNEWIRTDRQLLFSYTRAINRITEIKEKSELTSKAYSLLRQIRAREKWQKQNCR